MKCRVLKSFELKVCIFQAITSELSIETSKAVRRGLEEKVDVSGMLDQIIEEADESDYDLNTRMTHIQASHPLSSSPLLDAL